MLSANELIVYVMALFFVIGVADRCLNNRFGFSAELERGFSMYGIMALNVLGVVCISPLLAQLLQPVVLPVFDILGADPAMFSGTILSPDSGGFTIASELSADPRLTRFGGLLVAMLIGTVVCFTIPVTCGIVPAEDVRYFAAGVMAMFTVSPISCTSAGLLMGLPLGTVLRNLLPVILFAAAVIAGLTLIPQKMIRGFNVFSKGLRIIVMFGLVLGAMDRLVGLKLVDGLTPIDQGFQIIGAATLTMAGALPLLYFLQKVCARPLRWVQRKLGLHKECIANMIVSAVTIMPPAMVFYRFNPREKVLLAAAVASIGNTIGAPMGYIVTADQTMIVPMVLSKVINLILTLPMSVLIGRRLFAGEWKRRTEEGEENE